LRNAESSSIQGVIQESTKNVANVVKRGQRIYSNAIEGLAKQDLSLLKKNKRQIVKLSKEVNDLRDHVFYFIKNLDESSLGASNFYISLLGDLQDVTQSLEYISKVSFKHVNNNHKKLKYNQIQELKEIDNELNSLLSEIRDIFSQNEFSRIVGVLSKKQSLFDAISSKIEAQVARTRSDESSPKNTTLYFSLLLESKDLINTMMSFSELYHKEYDATIEPATIKED
jgi:Na+/phosphate symporter